MSDLATPQSMTIADVLLEAEREWERDPEANYVPTAETRTRIVSYLTALQECKSVKLAATRAGFRRLPTVAELRTKYPPLRIAEQFVREQLAGEVRSTLMEVGLEKKNVHALIHLDRLHSPEEYRREAPQPREINIAVSFKAAQTGTIPLGEPSKVIDARGHIIGMEGGLGLPDRPEDLAPRWLDTDDRWLLDPGGSSDDGGLSEADDDDGWADDL